MPLRRGRIQSAAINRDKQPSLLGGKSESVGMQASAPSGFVAECGVVVVVVVGNTKVERERMKGLKGLMEF